MDGWMDGWIRLPFFGNFGVDFDGLMDYEQASEHER